jgi:hypothetical protein
VVFGCSQSTNLPIIEFIMADIVVQVTQQEADDIQALANQLASKSSDEQHKACKQLFLDYVDTDHCACDEAVHRLVITCCSDKLVNLLEKLDDFGDQIPAFWAMLLLTELTHYHQDALVRQANIKAVLKVVLKIDNNMLVQELVRMVATNRRDFADAGGYHAVTQLVDRLCATSNCEAMQMVCVLMLAALDIQDESAKEYNQQFVKAGLVEAMFDMLFVAFDNSAGGVIHYASFILSALRTLGYTIPEELIAKLGAERWAELAGCPCCSLQVGSH